MRRYNFKISEEAQNDFDQYIDFIITEYDAIMTAEKHYEAISSIFLELSRNPFINAIRENPSLQKFGLNVRRQNFKKMAIIYTVHDDTVFIHRIVAASMISGL